MLWMHQIGVRVRFLEVWSHKAFQEGPGATSLMKRGLGVKMHLPNKRILEPWTVVG